MAVPQERLDIGTVEIHADHAGYESILTPVALGFLAQLHRRFDATRQRLLRARRERQAGYDAGALPDFRADTLAIRESDWTVAPIPAALQDRRVEITGPVERKMIINALNSGAKVFMADFEDSSAPTFANQLDGQINLRDAVNGTIEFHSPDGKSYRVNDKPAVLVVRPRGWHLEDKHFSVDGEPMSGALVDFGLFALHNARALHSRQHGPYFYLPKLEAMEEATLWDDVMAATEDELQLPVGTMKTTVLIETLPAAFQMHEILYALRRRVVGLNCGRWDYIFSYLKTLRGHRDRLLPERSQVLMTVPFLKAYSELLIQTCHRRGAFAMGGMAAQIPIKGDDAANEVALAKVRADKLREVQAGHDGTWVAHPALVPVAQTIFDQYMPAPNQLSVLRTDVQVTREQLLAAPNGTITRAGFDNNVEVCLRYTAAWLNGLGCVPIHHLMEDAATAEIARAQLWQWLHHGELEFSDHAPIDFALFDHAVAIHTHRLRDSQHPGADRADAAATLLSAMTHADQLGDFLTLPAYTQLA
ncbi:malate synthase A [Rhodanobacter glycinis]|uniref:malate synthase n=1 Tax=Rhodanobacter glycinis TaxID=582702 RepID=A0A502CFM4_9GAMM|nr:malate synthase A [Rhodanobacter glycinis]TPG11502.1 malate synthase A [Rhodanobacter glycinis]TPG47646.1 malate synthase A [Rhodanobacter glycinis]